jgi:hypothetical protein
MSIAMRLFSERLEKDQTLRRKFSLVEKALNQT